MAEAVSNMRSLRPCASFQPSPPVLMSATGIPHASHRDMPPGADASIVTAAVRNLLRRGLHVAIADRPVPRGDVDRADADVFPPRSGSLMESGDISKKHEAYGSAGAGNRCDFP
ncbi:hypothetical protein LGR54_15095 [Ancylobacter sp. Lp-2]|uniref:hypothetical protein n=1 Tax=Ancylobacter sp. Lp-2 TaxID=2881339 RepID=UPI001E5289F7|nr:hypothetical protein [Ancylobacter sp. Lp-2]MCB4769943.1 hypothetical protein [Ancylobacter sp. Lp-2]